MKKSLVKQRRPDFLVKCDTCSVYQIDEASARKFLTPELRQKVDEAIARQVDGIKLSFTGGCPKCKPANPDAEVEVSTIKRRFH